MPRPCVRIELLAGLRLAGAILFAFRRDRVQEAARMFQRVGIGGEARLGEARRHDPGMRGAAGVKRFRHRAEIRHQPGRLRGTESDRDRRLLRVQLAKFRAGRGGGGRTIKPGRMPAFLVQQPGLAQRQFSPHLIARDIGGDHVGAGESSVSASARIAGTSTVEGWPRNDTSS